MELCIVVNISWFFFLGELPFSQVDPDVDSGVVGPYNPLFHGKWPQMMNNPIRTATNSSIPAEDSQREGCSFPLGSWARAAVPSPDRTKQPAIDPTLRQSELRDGTEEPWAPLRFWNPQLFEHTSSLPLPPTCLSHFDFISPPPSLAHRKIPNVDITDTLLTTSGWELWH